MIVGSDLKKLELYIQENLDNIKILEYLSSVDILTPPKLTIDNVVFDFDIIDPTKIKNFDFNTIDRDALEKFEYEVFELVKEYLPKMVNLTKLILYRSTDDKITTDEIIENYLKVPPSLKIFKTNETNLSIGFANQLEVIEVETLTSPNLIKNATNLKKLIINQNVDFDNDNDVAKTFIDEFSNLPSKPKLIFECRSGYNDLKDTLAYKFQHKDLDKYIHKTTETIISF